MNDKKYSSKHCNSQKWKLELERLARIYSVEEDRTVTFLDLMRRAIAEKFQLEEEKNEK